jgi:hypothetical protein
MIFAQPPGRRHSSAAQLVIERLKGTAGQLYPVSRLRQLAQFKLAHP